MVHIPNLRVSKQESKPQTYASSGERRGRGMGSAGLSLVGLGFWWEETKWRSRNLAGRGCIKTIRTHMYCLGLRRMALLFEGWEGKWRVELQAKQSLAGTTEGRGTAGPTHPHPQTHTSHAGTPVCSSRRHAVLIIYWGWTEESEWGHLVRLGTGT